MYSKIVEFYDEDEGKFRHFLVIEDSEYFYFEVSKAYDKFQDTKLEEKIMNIFWKQNNE